MKSDKTPHNATFNQEDKIDIRKPGRAISYFLLLTSNFDVCMLARMRTCVQTPMSVRLYVCMYVCMCPNEGLIGTLCACCETCQTILAPETWKSVSVKKVSQTDGMVLGRSYELYLY